MDIIHLKIADQSLWGRMGEIVALIDAARRAGRERPGERLSLHPRQQRPGEHHPALGPRGGHATRCSPGSRTPSSATRLKREIRTGLPGWYNHYTAVGGDWSRMLVSARLSAANRRFQGKTMDRILAERAEGRAPAPDPLDLLFDFLIEEEGSIGTIYAHHTEEDMNLALVQPWCSIGSDGSALAIEGPLRRGPSPPAQLRHVPARPGRLRPRAAPARAWKTPSAR